MVVTQKEITKYLRLSKDNTQKLYKTLNDDTKSVDEKLEYANTLMNQFGVESLRDEDAWIDRYYLDTILLYVNTGETYDATLLYDTSCDNFLIGSWGDWYENWKMDRKQ